ncbi:unnamed protein product [Candidula unifasciata]|uniref:Uncharacterized protein n=1 Tax=Candidula unifasciata TaxID=100452 RepID=A0A8S4A359_9EUPU|nr:unnamed protein product [Candidula unifasciata]
MKEINKRDERLRILQLDKPQHGTSYITSNYSQYRQRHRKPSPTISDSRRRDSDFAFLPPIKQGRSFNLVEMFSGEKQSQKMSRQKTELYGDNSAPFSSKTKVRLGSESVSEKIVTVGNRGSGSSYGAHSKVKHDSNVFRRPKYMQL